MYQEAGLGFTNWRTSPGDTCDQLMGGQQRCFRTTTVPGDCPAHGGQCPPEQNFARAQGCVPRGERCSTSYGHPGLVWCCPPGWPLQPGSPSLEPGEQPPRPPLISPAMMRYLPWLIAAAGATGAIWYWQRKGEA